MERLTYVDVMKSIHYFLFILVLGGGCKKDNEAEPNRDFYYAIQTAKTGCGEDALPWLHELLTKAEEDKVLGTHNGRYLGVISMIHYNGNTMFYTDFLVTAVAFEVFDCEGNLFEITTDAETEFFRTEGTKRRNIIYANVPISS